MMPVMVKKMANRNALYITPGIALMNSGAMGLKKKITGQCSALARLGYKTTIAYHADGEFVFQDDQGNKKTYKLPRVLWVIGYIKPILKKYIHEAGISYELVYIRKASSETPFSLSAVKFLRKHTDRIVCEIATYPYDNEMRGMIRKLSFPKDIVGYIWYIMSWYISDRICRRYLKKYIDCFAVVTSSPSYETVFGAPGIKLSNGVDLDNIPMRTRVPDERLVLIGVAGVSYWHGYDRVIRGMYEYYLRGFDTEIIFHVVGEGDSVDELKQLASKLKLEERVFFHGLRFGSELDEIINKADMGVASLAHFRMKRTNTSELKIREYCARALPYIVAAIDNDIPDTFSWKLRIVNNDTPVDFNEVIDFHLDCVSRQGSLHEMRDFAREKLSWDAQLKNVLDFVEAM